MGSGMGASVKVVIDSAEYQYLNDLNTLKGSSSYWVALNISVAGNLKFQHLIDDIKDIENKLDTLKEMSDEYLEKLQNALRGYNEVIIYQFKDYDILALVNVKDNSEGREVQQICEKLKESRGAVTFNQGVLTYELYRYQKMVDEKFLSRQRMEALENMTDKAKTDSIPLRRKRRDEQVIMIVEDDRFTASYTASLLNKEFDVVCAKNGEDAIDKYIEHAPDAVFLDIILPGISGKDTLKGIKAVDPDAFVVMLSVDTVAKNIKEASKEGAYGFLKKPFGKERLVKTARKSPFIKQEYVKSPPEMHSV